MDTPNTALSSAASAAPAAAGNPTDTSGGPEGDYSELFGNPIIQPLLAGAVPAIRFDPKSVEPAIKQIVSNSAKVLAGGLSVYKTLKTTEVVVFNPEKTTGDALKTADAAGNLQAIVPPANEFITVTGAPPVTVANAATTASALPIGQSAKSANKITQARLKSLLPGSPTDRPMPGAGVLNDLLARPV